MKTASFGQGWNCLGGGGESVAVGFYEGDSVVLGSKISKLFEEHLSSGLR